MFCKYFCSRETLITWIREVVKEHGFIVVIKASKLGVAGKKPRLRLACEWSGTYMQSKETNPNKQEMYRKGIGTKKCGCPFEIHGIKFTKDEELDVKVVCGFDNQLEGHSYVGQL